MSGAIDLDKRRLRCAPGSQADALFAIAIALNRVAAALEITMRICAGEDEFTDTSAAAAARQPET